MESEEEDPLFPSLIGEILEEEFLEVIESEEEVLEVMEEELLEVMELEEEDLEMMELEEIVLEEFKEYLKLMSDCWLWEGCDLKGSLGEVEMKREVLEVVFDGVSLDEGSEEVIDFEEEESLKRDGFWSFDFNFLFCIFPEKGELSWDKEGEVEVEDEYKSMDFSPGGSLDFGSKKYFSFSIVFLKALWRKKLLLSFWILWHNSSL